jgi:hypothetical protein
MENPNRETAQKKETRKKKTRCTNGPGPKRGVRSAPTSVMYRVAGQTNQRPLAHNRNGALGPAGQSGGGSGAASLAASFVEKPSNAVCSKELKLSHSSRTSIDIKPILLER